MRPGPLTALMAMLSLSVATPAYSGNLITNPTFKDPVSCPGQIPFTSNLWSTSSSMNVNVASTNVSNNTLLKMERGSLLPPSKTAPFASESAYASQCISGIVPGSYEFGAYVQVNPMNLATPVAEVRVTLFDSMNCSGNVLSGGQSLQKAESTNNSLVKLAGPVTVPVNAVSAAFDLIGTFASDDALQSVYFDDAFLSPPGTCQPGPNTQCLNGGRFEVSATWATGDGGSGQAGTLPFTDDTGLFWFFDPSNAELTVKVINACSDPFNRYWVFASGLTNVEVEITVTDTGKPEADPVVYKNPLNTPFAPIQDTNAFATCP